jgi:hypothetical protein
MEIKGMMPDKTSKGIRNRKLLKKDNFIFVTNKDSIGLSFLEDVCFP